jgi:predicted transposase/invertase (TIGR01784 family)
MEDETPYLYEESSVDETSHFNEEASKGKETPLYENLTECKTPYSYQKPKVDKKHDKIFKDILHSKDEMTKFITNFIGNAVKKEELELYNTNYITEEYKSKETDIVYKIKGQEIYYLIEHQTKVDHSMAYRILNYCVEIMRNVVKNKNVNNVSYRYPIIVPIVLYAGNQKWTAPTAFAQIKIKTDYLNESKIDIEYKLIDVNKYSEEELLEQKSMLGNVMLLEKCKNKEEAFEKLKKIIKNIDNKKNVEEIKRIIFYLYNNMSSDKTQELIDLINEGEENEMSTISERIAAEFKNERVIGRREGVREGEEKIKNIIKNMILLNLDSSLIQKVTGEKVEDIEKIKQEVSAS